MPTIDLNDAYILDETGAEVDKTTGIPFKNEGLTDAQAAQARANIRAGASNRNLLDNPWFTVNQRGNASYSSAGYSVDRWLSNGPQQVTVSDGGVTLGEQGYRFVQRIEKPAYFAGQTITISAKTSASKVRFALWDSTSDYANGYAETVTTVNGYASLTRNITNGIYAAGLSTAGETGGLYRAMKLELGSYSTLANDVPPDYYKELDHCKWYFERIKSSLGAWSPIGTGIADQTGRAAILIPMHPKRDGSFTVTSNGTFRLIGAINSPVTALSKGTSQSTTALSVNATTSSTLTVGSTQLLQANNSADWYIDVANDL